MVAELDVAGYSVSLAAREFLEVFSGHMTLVIDETGAFWGGFDAEYGLMGENIVDVIRALLIEPDSRPLDRVVPD